MNGLNILTTVNLEFSAFGKLKKKKPFGSVALKILGKQTEAKVRVAYKLD